MKLNENWTVSLYSIPIFKYYRAICEEFLFICLQTKIYKIYICQTYLIDWWMDHRRIACTMHGIKSPHTNKNVAHDQNWLFRLKLFYDRAKSKHIRIDTVLPVLESNRKELHNHYLLELENIIQRACATRRRMQQSCLLSWRRRDRILQPIAFDDY